MYLEGTWLLLSKEEIHDEDKYDLEKFKIYDEELVYQKIPKIKGHLNEEEETFVFIDEIEGTVNVNPKHKHLGFSTADMARATNQNVRKQSFWDYYNPIPIPLGVKNHKVVKTKIQEIPIREWKILNEKLVEFGKDIAQGYYPIDIKTSSWKNIDDPKFTQFDDEKK